ncbi:MAG: exodeoxyribonuclease VII large subunit [Bacteroidia bacterium]
MKEESVYSVSQLTLYVKHLLEDDPVLQGVRVSGEISNLTYHRSGHVYFSLKDREAQVSCVMWRSYAQTVPRIAEGEQIVITGSMNLYPPRGTYQLVVSRVEKQGLGDLYQRFVELKDRLQREGLFETSRKRPLPPYPATIAVLTSPTGAAVRDVLRTLARRYRRGQAVVIPTVVQGKDGPPSIVRSLQQACEIGADVVILARGGGSLEDLWNFNEEVVARAIAACDIPVITGIGHESDFTIADLVADLRASTPTAAAEYAVPDTQALHKLIDQYERQLQQGLRHYIEFKRQVLDDYGQRLEQAWLQQLRSRRHELDLLEARLRAGDITQLLQQGYTLTLRDGLIQRSAAPLTPGDVIETIFADGRLRSQVEVVSDPL